MNWWNKIQLSKEDQETKNRYNRYIGELANMKEELVYCGKLVFQSSTAATNLLNIILENKPLSSYQDVVQTIKEAKGHSLDSPNKFQQACQTAANDLDRIIAGMRQERDEIGKAVADKAKGLVSHEQ